MKLLHLADLHLGKRVNEFSMLDSQRYVLHQALDLIDSERIDAVIVAGDVFDKSIPSEEAVRLFDDFLYKISQKNKPALVVSGNHDSSQRISFGSRMMSQSGVYISPVYDGNLVNVKLSDAHGDVDFWLLPFIKPCDVRNIYTDADITSYTDAVRFAIQKAKIDYSDRNVLVAHQFVTSQQDVSVGGIDNVDVSVFERFDYVALGHIHKPQYIKNQNIRYSGSPLKYSLSEIEHEKGFAIIDIGAKGDVDISFVPVKPKHDMRMIKGTYLQLTDKSFYENTATDDFIHAVLTDEEDVVDAIGKLRVIYPNIMSLSYENERTAKSNTIIAEQTEDKSPLDMFKELYSLQNNIGMSEEQQAYCEEIMNKIWEDNA